MCPRDRCLAPSRFSRREDRNYGTIAPSRFSRREDRNYGTIAPSRFSRREDRNYGTISAATSAKSSARGRRGEDATEYPCRSTAFLPGCPCTAALTFTRPSCPAVRNFWPSFIQQTAVTLLLQGRPTNALDVRLGFGGVAAAPAPPAAAAAACSGFSPSRPANDRGLRRLRPWFRAP